MKLSFIHVPLENVEKRLILLLKKTLYENGIQLSNRTDFRYHKLMRNFWFGGGAILRIPL